MCTPGAKSAVVDCLVVVTDGAVQDAEDARRDEEERARRSDQMRKDRAAVRLITHSLAYAFKFSKFSYVICDFATSF